MATHSSILGWEIPWTEESGWLHCVVSQRSRTRLSDSTTIVDYSSLWHHTIQQCCGGLWHCRAFFCIAKSLSYAHNYRLIPRNRIQFPVLNRTLLFIHPQCNCFLYQPQTPSPSLSLPSSPLTTTSLISFRSVCILLAVSKQRVYEIRVATSRTIFTCLSKVLLKLHHEIDALKIFTNQNPKLDSLHYICLSCPLYLYS